MNLSYNQYISLEKSTTTPMMEQYLEIKSRHQDCLLFYRMGDFYELFFEDAAIAAKILNIALTKRGKHDNLDIAMCGVPHHASENYLHKLITEGHKVAICEQLETPQEAKKRGSKSVVRREVVRVITPGTITEDNLLEAREPNYLASIVQNKDEISIAYLDLSTGDICSYNSCFENIIDDLARINPKELLLCDKLYHDQRLSGLILEYKGRFTTQVNSFFEYERCQRSLKNFYQVYLIDSFGDFSNSEISALGAIIEYISITQKGNVPYLLPPKKIALSQFMHIDSSTRRSLELIHNLDGKTEGSLLNILDKTKTSAGSRLLSSYIMAPLVNIGTINQRLDNVEYFYKNHEIRIRAIDILSGIPDLERTLSRINLNRSGPRDLLMIREGLHQAKLLAELLKSYPIDHYHDLTGYDQLITFIEKAIKDEVPLLSRDGGFIKEGYDQKIDELVNINVNSKAKILELKEEYRQKTGISNLKIEQNNVIGFYIEVTAANANKITDDFIFRQNTANYSRYTSLELKNIEYDIMNAKDIVIKLELEIFAKLVEEISKLSHKIIQTAKIIASIDVSSCLASIAKDNNYTRPLVDLSDNFILKNARHPVVEARSSLLNQEFIANNCNLARSQRIWLITGPNMAGKSTFLRQNALIAIMAQMGGFVPAESVHIGVIDRIFSRVGAADDLARGRSTFMVEMVEVATILNQATSKSLVILDEIGRGTATYDGLSIAYSTLEYLNDKIRCRALFATHYHELTVLSEKLDGVKTHSMKIKEWQGKVIFLHQIIEGSINKSYGIHVAKLAGVPLEVIKRSQDMMKMLDSGNISEDNSQLPLFNRYAKPSKLSKISQILDDIDLNDISTEEAFACLEKLKSL